MLQGSSQNVPASANVSESLQAQRRIKKDHLWRNLLAEFHRHYQNLISEAIQLQDEKNPRLRSKDELESKAGQLLLELGLAESLAQSRQNRHIFIVLGLPVATTRLNRSLALLPQSIRTNAYHILMGPLQVFKENSRKTRHAFFSSALIERLWSAFVNGHPNRIKDVLTGIKGQNNGSLKAMVLLHDIRDFQAEIDI